MSVQGKKITAASALPLTTKKTHQRQTTPDHSEQEAAWVQANAGPEATCLPSYP